MPKAQKLRRHHISVDPYKKFENDNEDMDVEQTHLPQSIIRKNKKKKGNDTTSISSSSSSSSDSKALLSELEATLQASATTAATSQSIKPAAISSSFVSHKITKEVAVREATRMKLVQQLPGFDLVALHKHLDQMTTIKQRQVATSSESQIPSHSTNSKSVPTNNSAKKSAISAVKSKSSSINKSKSSSSSSSISSSMNGRHDGKAQSKSKHKKAHK